MTLFGEPTVPQIPVPAVPHDEQLAEGMAGRLKISREMLRGLGMAAALIAIVWGVWTAWPTFDVFNTSPVYARYKEYPEWLWGSYAALAGLCQFIGLRRHLPLLSFLGAILLIAFFLFGATDFLIAEKHSHGTPLFLLYLSWEVLLADAKGRTAPNLVTIADRLLHRPLGRLAKHRQSQQGEPSQNAIHS